MAANATGSTAIMVGRCIMFLRKKKVSQIEKQKNRKLSMEIVRLISWFDRKTDELVGECNI